MFKLNVRDKYEKIMFWKKNLLIVVNFCILLYFLLVLIFNKEATIFNFLVVTFSIIIQLILNLIVKAYIILQLKKEMIYETLSILKNTKLPSKLPKVVYVYTTHNDFWEARLLQSMQQTYKNIEYWISDGSSDKEKSKEIQAFCTKYNVNYHSLNRPSTNKADSLNHFLKYSGAKFDYLLISDSDVAINKNFVSTSLKFFYYQKQKQLGWVSSNIINYSSNNLWNILMSKSENIAFINKFLLSNINNKMNSNLYSAACLISKNMLDSFNYQFPEGSLEDVYLECFGYKNGWNGYINPITISMQTFDKNIINFCKRTFRVDDWMIKYLKEFFFKRNNEEKLETNYMIFQNAFSRFLQILSLPLIAFLISFVIFHFDTLISNPIFIWTFWAFLAYLISVIIYWIAVHVQLLGKHIISCSIMFLIHFIALFWLVSFRKFNSFFRSKYAEFIPSRGYKTSNKMILIKQILQVFFSLIILVSFNIASIYFQIWNINWGWLYLFVLINLIVGLLFLSPIFFLISYALSFIIVNKNYNKDNWVYCNNQYVNNKKIIDKWLINNNIDEQELFN